MHAEAATVLGTYGADFYAGWPVLTENEVGKGYAYYIGTDPEPEFLLHFYRTITADAGVYPIIEGPDGVEVTRRRQEDRSFLFVLNHNDDVAFITLPDGRFADMFTGQVLAGNMPLRGYDVRILEEL
jgi:beta-galactosidase